MVDDEYPSVDEWTYITIEGYCSLNLEYSTKYDPYVYKLDGTKIPNSKYDPSLKIEPYPENCQRKVSFNCIKCKHFMYSEVEPHIAYI